MDLHGSAKSVCQEAMALLRQEMTLTDAVLTGVRANKVERACHRQYENCRMEVLCEFGWSFVRRTRGVASSACNEHGVFSFAYPSEALKILACYDQYGHKIEYSVKARERVETLEPAAKFAYIEDEKDVSLWPVEVRKALVSCIAAALAIEITGRIEDAQFAKVRYNEDLQAARTNDARQSGTGQSAYGGNYIYECMTGRRNAFARRGLT